ncbi:hypothetical protein SDC9_57178 [bioreactor metagenome]|uniref:Uncharacterized protein n=1 Tax=bioreactor metagenome TaxID=1076179 RepID=A0A644X9A7_9ZZZZ
MGVCAFGGGWRQPLLSRREAQIIAGIAAMCWKWLRHHATNFKSLRRPMPNGVTPDPKEARARYELTLANGVKSGVKNESAKTQPTRIHVSC